MNLLSKLCGVAIIGAALVLAPVTSANASPGGVEVSGDGTSYGSSYPGALFDDIDTMVPGDAQAATFYVRNSSIEPGFLRITMRDVVASDADLADALSVALFTSEEQGRPASLSEATPCRVLIQGQRVEPGEVVPVQSSLVLGQLDGQKGQAATASLAIQVSLSGVPMMSLPLTQCSSGTTIPVTPGTPPTTPTGTPAAILAPGAGFSDALGPQVPTIDGSDIELPVLNLPGLLGIDPNTWHLFEEYLILIPIGASVLGALVFAAIGRRRRRTETPTEEAA
ncbi:hypothetical protein FB562_0709 [Homoserinimonas aerilata]|uniref:Uncharacterized protein n=1 Tax=Homoserinimonas aerilata TaxID=1162970 RepID=A0A542YHR4_9MICO|nr:hypothetical protein [Homoserinimonas aerilata]TQL47643.1 hypothetical protein FB562_0709 [Homoserinimonas aerilata]